MNRKDKATIRYALLLELKEELKRVERAVKEAEEELDDAIKKDGQYYCVDYSKKWARLKRRTMDLSEACIGVRRDG